MKKRKLSGKLRLNKERVSRLSAKRMSEIKGRGDTVQFTTPAWCETNLYTSRGIDCN